MIEQRVKFEMKGIMVRKIKRIYATCIYAVQPCLITVSTTPQWFFGTFSFHRVWQQGNTSSPCVFTLLSRTLISTDSQSAPTWQAWVNKKSLGFKFTNHASTVQNQDLCSPAVENTSAVCVKIQMKKKKKWQGLGKAPQHFSLNWDRQVVKEQDEDKYLVRTMLTFSWHLKKT